MVSLHGIWWQARFHLWGERAAIEDSTVSRAGAVKKPGSRSRPLRHPTALSAQELHAHVGEISPDGLLASIADESSIDLWLPCVDGVPLPSVGFDRQSGADNATLRGVRAATLAFSAADTIDLLVSLPHRWLQTSSDSVRYWRRLAELVMSLLARQQFVPDIEQTAEEGFSARWRVFVLSRQELAWLERYAAAMPPVCRAVVTEHGEKLEPARIVDEFLVQAADAVIRRILAHDSFFEQIHGRAAKEGSRELRWLSGLVGEQPALGGGAEENAALADEVRSWIGQLEDEAGDLPSELSFTLIEPEESAEDSAGTQPLPAAGAPWCVRFGLRSREGGRILDVSTVWARGEDKPTILGRHLVNRREHLMAELRRASEVFPVLTAALASAAPTGVQLTTNEAHTFLHEWSPLLRGQGFGVTLPAWAEGREHRLGLELVVRPQGPEPGNAEVGIASFGLSSMLEFDWQVAIGGEPLAQEEFERIASETTPLVKVRGSWLDVDHQAAQKALDFMRNQPGGRMTLVEAIHLGSGAGDLDAGLPIVTLKGTSWIEQFLADAADTQIDVLEQPPEFRGTLRPYQRAALNWLAFLDSLGIGACLADDMGLGKTIELIALLLHERRGKQAVGPTLLFAPMSVVGNWEREIQRFAPTLRVLVHHGPDRLCGTAFTEAAERHDVVITTFGLAQRDLKDLRRVDWHRIALDEAQKIKNPSASQTIAIRSLRSKRRAALTGTPIENHLSELWSIMEMLNPGVLGSAAAFRKRFAIPIEKLGDQQRAGQLRRMIRPFVLRRLKSDPKIACDLPEKMEMRVYCNLTPEQATHYERTVNALLSEVDTASGIRRRGMILATLTRLKQVCNHPTHLLRDGGPLDRRSGKCERLVEMLEEVLAEGDEALVFTQFREMGTLLVRLLTTRLRIEIPFLHGGTTAKERNRMILDFQDPDSGVRVFLLSLKAGGFGLNLTKANHVFHFDRWWNPAVENQATDRVHRIGQTRRVQVHKFVCIGTIEDRIDQVLSEKAALADRIVGGGDDWLTGLSVAELRDYFTLSREAIAEI
jgi:superfamily II DNA or RNA helicase